MKTKIYIHIYTKNERVYNFKFIKQINEQLLKT